MNNDTDGLQNDQRRRLTTMRSCLFIYTSLIKRVILFTLVLSFVRACLTNLSDFTTAVFHQRCTIKTKDLHILNEAVLWTGEGKITDTMLTCHYLRVL